MANKLRDKNGNIIDLYWAADTPETLIAKCESKTEDFFRWIDLSGTRNIMRRSWMFYNTSKIHGSGYQLAGEFNEYMLFKVNEYRSILQQLISLVIAQRPAWDAKATNADAQSLAQCKVAKSVLDYYMRTKDIDKKLYRMVEYAATLGEGYIQVTWDALGGKEYIPATSSTKRVMEGDIDIKVFSGIDIIRDVSVDLWEQNKWVIVREYHNKYDLAVRYPEHYDEIMSYTQDDSNEGGLKHFRTYYKVGFEKDTIPVYVFYHKKTDALPSGRHCVYLESQTMLYDEALAYKDIPLYRCSGGEMDGTTMGYSVAFDMIGVQEQINALHSIITTNIKSFGIQNIVGPKGSGLSEMHVVGQLAYLEVDDMAQAPKVLNLLSTPPEVYSYLQYLVTKMETLSGVNATARGNPPSNVGSGSGMALIQSLATQYNQQLQSNYIGVVEKIGTAIIDLLKDYANAPRMIEISGKANRSYIKEFVGADINSIDRVVADVGNPMTKTIQGKFQLGQMLVQAGLVNDANELLSVIEYGSLDTLTDGPESEVLNIQKENDELRDGNNVIVIPLDNHINHIREHMALIADPVARRDDSPFLSNVLQHIAQHVQYLQDPQYATLYQIMGMPVPGQQGQPQPGQPGQPGNGQQTGPQQKLTQVGHHGKASGGAPNLPNLPDMPGPKGQPKQQWSPQGDINSLGAQG